VTAQPFRYRETDAVGVYIAEAEEQKQYFTVNLVNATESNISAPERLTAPATPPPMTAATPQTQPVWTWFLVIAGVVVMGEWYVWLKTG